MFEEESIWIKKSISKILDDIHTVLDVGSSTLDFRTKVQPFIEENIFKPLRSKGKKVHHLDIKEGPGIDIVCDITQPNAYSRIGQKFDLVICTNSLEHVPNMDVVADNLKKLVKKDGYLLVTVPYCYFYHPDPIDTMYRPTNKELEMLFSDFKVIDSEIIKIKKLYLRKRLQYLRQSLVSWRILRKNLPILFKGFKISCVLLKK